MQAMTKSLYQWMVSQPKYVNSFLNRFKLRARMLVKGCVAIFSSKNMLDAPIECDILLIHPSYNSYKQGRKKQLINMLKEKGLIVEEFVEKKDKEKIVGREFCKINDVPLLFKWEAYHAGYILNKYQAKVILTERNGWVLPSFIKKIRREGSIIMHMAHSIPTSQSSKYNYYDYDYYLIYGKSSYDYLRGLDGCFGSCQFVFAGPYFFYSDRKYKRNNKIERNITFICSGPGYESNLPYIKLCAWIDRLVEESVVDKLYVKCHPRGDNERWLKILDKYPDRVKFANDDELHDCLDDSQYAVMNYTNAIIDTTYYGIPIILLGETDDYFSVSDFSIPWARDYHELSKILKAKFVFSEKKFISYHIENKQGASQFLVDFVYSITNEEKNVLNEVKGVLVGDF
ncbi:MAG: hypothetical protein GXZ15_06360 [Campylobacter sp.]|nr:hypothetical protein [Campylobacter sp.]